MSASGASSGVQAGTGANVLATAATILTSSRVTGDTRDRFQVLADGTLEWGSGAAVPDTRMYRSAAGVMRLGPPATGAGGLEIDSNGSASTLTFTLGGGSYWRFTNTSADGSIGFAYTGSSTSVWRVAAGNNPIQFFATSTAAQVMKLQAKAGQAVNLVDVLAGDGTTKLLSIDSAGNLLFSTDTRLTRTAASTLGLDNGAGAAATLDLATAGSKIKFNAGTTGSGTALLGANCPAVTVAAPFTWLQATASDGSAIFIPAWK